MEKLINEKIKELTQNGKLDEIVTKQATDFVTNVVRVSLESYGEVQKMFKEKLNQNLLANLERLDFVQYSKTISDLIEAELNKTIFEIGITPIKEMIKTFTGELEKKEWKMSEIIQKFLEKEVMDQGEQESGEIAFIHNVSDWGTHSIYFDEDPNKEYYRCKYRLMIDKSGEMYSPTIDSENPHPISECGGLYGFDLFLFKLYATKCTIIMDSVETEWSTYRD